MSYQSNIPLSTDKINVSQAAILSNFQALNAYFGRNHTPFGNNTTPLNGKHSFIEMVSSASKPAPAPSLAASTSTLYSKIAGAISDIFYIHDNVTTQEYQITNVAKNPTDFSYLGTNIALPSGSSSSAVGGWTWLGQGIIMQYGTVSFTGGGNSRLIIFPVAFTTTPFSITTSALISAVPVPGGPICISSVSSTQMILAGPSPAGTTTALNWMAIGTY